MAKYHFMPTMARRDMEKEMPLGQLWQTGVQLAGYIPYYLLVYILEKPLHAYTEI